MLINEATWEFVRQHRQDDVRRLALQGAKAGGVDLPVALQQIAGWQVALKKLPTWAGVEGIVYPPHLNMEQCSSEQAARYKAGIAGSGQLMADLTGGFGIDFYWMSRGFSQRTYVERDEALCRLASHNFGLLGLDCSVCCGTTATYLAGMPHADLVFLDPARRDEHGSRTYGIADCTPNVLELLPLLGQKTDRLLLKLSPMLDWRKAVSDLNLASPDGALSVTGVHIVSVDNECKELLLLLDKEPTDALHVHCVNDDQDVVFIPTEGILGSHGGNSGFPLGESSTGCDHAPLYLYEPNASVMKSGCFAELATRYGVRQLAPNSHLFLSAFPIVGFPGRSFQILSISSANRKKFSESLASAGFSMERANISVRNFPLTADQLRKKLKVKDGGEAYIFATTLADGTHRLFICRKIG